VYATILAGNNRIEKRALHRFMDIAKRVRNTLQKKEVIFIEGFYDSKGSAVSVQYKTDWILRSELLQAGFRYHEVPTSPVKVMRKKINGSLGI
jgi:crossover junction endodeoxyribonuclease RuvC